MFIFELLRNEFITTVCSSLNWIGRSELWLGGIIKFALFHLLQQSKKGYRQTKQKSFFIIHPIVLSLHYHYQINDLHQQNIVIMSIEKDAPLAYQITVNNVATIGTKSMADFYISFVSQSKREWKSPTIHGKVTKQNTKYPWTFSVDNNQLTANFHQLDDKNGTDYITGIVPLSLLKREGEEEFIIFGCTQKNRGRKVAEVEFTYVQVSAIKSVSTNKKSDFSNERASLQFTIEIQNYDPKKSLNIIPQESQQINSKLPNNDTLIEQNQLHPSKVSTLKLQSNRNKMMSEDNSNFELNLIKEMQDATDRWYRNNYGKSKPTNLDYQDFDNENSRVVSIVYEKDYEYLNDISFTNPHMELKNMMVNSQKKPKTIQIYSINMDGSRLIKDKIASVHVPNGYKHEWNQSIRLPKQKKVYGLQIITVQKEKLQGLINKDSSHSKNHIEIYNKDGKKVGTVNYSLKEIKKIQIQTLEIMKADEQYNHQLDKSFLKSENNTVLPNQTQVALFQNSFKKKNKLMKQIYLNRIKELPYQELVQPYVRNRNQSQDIRSKIEVRKSITNDAYLNQTEQSHKKRSLRKNQYEVDPNPNPNPIHPFKVDKTTITTPLKYSSINHSQEIQTDQYQERSPEKEEHLTRKIEQLKKMGNDLGKIAKVFPSKKFLKNTKYKTVIYQQQKNEQLRRSPNNSDSQKQIKTNKKSYREPINANPSSDSLLINHTFSKPLQSNEKLKIIPQSEKQQTARSPPREKTNDQQQQIPIIRHKTADQYILNQMIQKANKKDSQRLSLGVNTQRLAITNVLQSSIGPTTPTQKRPTRLNDFQTIDHQVQDWQGKASSKEQVGSIGDSIIANNRTKYSSRTIQPATQLPPGKLNYLITSISIDYYDKTFGNKFVKIYIPNKHYYQTPSLNNPNTLFWKCNGFLFSNLHQHQDLYIQLYNSRGEEQKMLGRVIISSREFHPNAENAVIRAYLILESKVVGEIVISYQAVNKFKNRTNRDVSTQPRQAFSQSHNIKTTPPKPKRKKRNKTLNDSLTRFLQKNRKQKINRYIVNEYSRAHIDSRMAPVQQKKYKAGKNIVIGKDIRFPFGPDQQQKVLVPGPGAYPQPSQFQRYKGQTNKIK